ncbi:DUF4367 domain-containing protein [Paenibacillus sp. VMFN-D1]|uniref:DUF4367 domain-containing protein n=1 Tax=Paenibacillus sp. VMFN-D1 TaxID=2135608 RepID=UPI000E24A587|nr:DUF4367 domain-containing protein [Paenibacillus sp. VMFN-D1]RED39869.1 uncharacterized protein DUF4367 [Paenibacillus sp. VMFN-D1]
MKSEKFEEWFDSAFEKAASSTSLTSEDSKKASWNKVRARLNEVNRSRRRNRHLQLGGVVAASFVAGAVIFSSTAVTKAISPLIDSIVDWGDGVKNVAFLQDDQSDTGGIAKTPPPPNYMDGETDPPPWDGKIISSEQGVPTTRPLSEVQKELSFTIPDFSGRIPERYHFKQSTVIAKDLETKKYNEITMLYTGPKEDDNLFITVSRILPNSSTGYFTNGEPVKIKLKNGYEAYYTESNMNSLIMKYNKVQLYIISTASKEEILNLVEPLP